MGQYTRKEKAKMAGISDGNYYKLDQIKKSGNKEVIEQTRHKKISVDKAYQMIKNPEPKEKEPITPVQKIIECDNRMNEIDKEISSLKTERNALMRKRSILFESFNIPCELKYEFVEKDKFGLCRDCVFYIEIEGRKQILANVSVYNDESPLDSWSFIMGKIPEKYRNDFIMLWKKAHYEELEEVNRRLDELNNKQQKAELNNIINEDNKDFYKKCFRILAKTFHPDNEEGNMEDMQCLNQLKVMWGIQDQKLRYTNKM